MISVLGNTSRVDVCVRMHGTRSGTSDESKERRKSKAPRGEQRVSCKNGNRNGLKQDRVFSVKSRKYRTWSRAFDRPSRSSVDRNVKFEHRHGAKMTLTVMCRPLFTGCYLNVLG